MTEKTVASRLSRARRPRFEAQVEQIVARAGSERLRIGLGVIFSALAANASQQLQAEILNPGLAAEGPHADLMSNVLNGIRRAAPLLMSLDLDQRAPLKVLEAGRSQGYFLFCARSFGHDVAAFKNPHPQQARLLDLFGVRILDAKDAEADFDLIVATGLALAGERDWQRFIRPLARRINDRGTLHLALHPKPIAERNYKPESAAKFFAGIGSEISPEMVVSLSKADADAFAEAN